MPNKGSYEPLFGIKLQKGERKVKGSERDKKRLGTVFCFYIVDLRKNKQDNKMAKTKQNILAVAYSGLLRVIYIYIHCRNEY